MFAWFRRRRRQKILAQPCPAGWVEILAGIPHVERLPASARRRHLDATRIFLAEKTFEGCGGLTLTDEITVTIAGLATILILEMEENSFDNVVTILVYPDAFAVPERVDIGASIALEDEGERLGEAHHRGPVILAWKEIENDIREPGLGRNLVFHEFAHQLDMQTGDADGVPPLPAELQEEWARVMAKEYRRLQKAVRRHRDSLIDPYGATDPAEFFAVITEIFFDAPSDLRIEYPELYDVLKRYYRQDPAAIGD